MLQQQINTAQLHNLAAVQQVRQAPTHTHTHAHTLSPKRQEPCFQTQTEKTNGSYEQALQGCLGYVEGGYLHTDREVKDT